MAMVTVERIDEGVVRRLEQRAAANNRSLDAELRDILERAASDEGEELAEKMRTFRESMDAIKAARDADGDPRDGSGPDFDALEHTYEDLIKAKASGDRAAWGRAAASHTAELRKLTAGRPQTPSEQLIRESRDSGYGRYNDA